MSDLVKRLRDHENEGVTSSDRFHQREEAAGRIERLEAALKGTLYLFEGYAVTKTDIEQIRYARAALEDSHA